MNLNELDIPFLNEGITHIEELPIDSFLNAVKNINMFEISEKVDGANLQFGLDEKGKFFTSREGKSGSRYYDYHDWGDKFWQTGFKSAHAALEKVAKQVLKPGDAVEVEILFGELPNAVPYSGEENQIIFLRPVSGRPDTQKMADQLEGQSVNVTVDKVPYTEDGKTIQFRPEEHKWTFAKVPNVPTDSVSKEEAKSIIDDKVKKLEAFMKEEVKVSNTTMPIPELLAIKLNTRPKKIPQADWKTVKEEIKVKKEEVLGKLREIQLEVKDVLLNELVRNVRSAFGPELDDGGWIEGVVMRHKDTGEMIKIVDKSIFTAINKFNHIIRGRIADNRNSESVKQALTTGLANAIGHPTLASNAAKRYLQKFGGNGQEILKNLGGQIDFEKAKPQFTQMLATADKNLNALRDEYQKTKDTLSTKVDFGKRGEKKFNYQGEIDRRTLQAFAELEKDIAAAKESVASAKTGADLLNILAGDKLSSLNESIITEGGHAVPNVGAITREEIGPTLLNFSQVVGIPATMLKDNMIGSGGQTAISGDIDIALSSQTYKPEELQARLESAVGSENVKYMKGFDVLSTSFPIEHFDDGVQTDQERTGRVQIDLMFGQPKWMKFGYHSAGDKSKYKGMYRTILIMATAASMGQAIINKDGEIIGKLGPTMIMKLGVQIQAKRRKTGKDGKLQKGEEKMTLQDFKAAFPDADIDQYSGKILIDDPDEVAKFLFGDVKPNVKASDLDSFEKVLRLVKQKPQGQQDFIKEKTKERLDQAGKPMPEELLND